MTRTTCPTCGGEILKADARTCEFCGRDLPVEDSAEPSPEASPAPLDADALPAGRLQDVLPRLLPRVRSAPEFRQLEEHTPSGKDATMRMGCGVAFGLLFAAFGGFWTYMAWTLSEDGSGDMRWFPLFGLLFVGIGLAVAGGTFRKAMRFKSALLERRVAGILDERVHIRGRNHQNGPSTSTTYFATFLFESGERKELRVPGKIASGVAPGDVGVAYLKGDVLLEFRAVAL